MTLRSPFASIVRPLAASAALFAVCSYAAAQGIPCSYEVAGVIQGPPCGIGSPITTATAINSHGTVVGHYRCQAGNPRPFKWTKAGGLELIPLPSWLVEASPADVNDNNIMVGTGVGPVAGQRGFVCDLNTGVWTELLPLNPPIGWSGATGSTTTTLCAVFARSDRKVIRSIPRLRSSGARKMASRTWD